MLVLETIAKIRRLSLVQGKSIKAICRELKISRTRNDSLRRTNSHGTHRGTGTDGSAEALRNAQSL
ncbi:MAG: hypothetical protein E5Y29_16490 [Mesorhizobium sp.]|nr:MAG: hypothetical protein E5Y29_16490 [Mesorhizobium sp.]